MRILTFTTLYPNAAMPGFGQFVEARILDLARSGEAQIRVLAPVPYFPLRHAAFGDYALFARVPREETRGGLKVLHPRYPVLPKIGAWIAPISLALAASRAIGRLKREGVGFDLIDAHYFYPDGVAAALIAWRYGKPLVITARGSDINVIGKLAFQRRLIRWAGRKAARVISVSAALKAEMASLGIPEDRIEVIRNGVDLEKFRVTDRAAARRRFGLTRPTLLMAGNLVALKGHALAVAALPLLKGADLAIAGDGPERANIERRARELGVTDRVKFLGRLSQPDLSVAYNAADALVLASASEGLANVLIEAMACGLPAIATDVGGSREVIDSPDAGILLAERSPEAIAAAARRLFASPPIRSATRRLAERFTWEKATAAQLALFRSIVGGRDRG